MNNSSGFFNTLFDFSFSEFVTTKIIKILYAIGIFFAAIGALMFIIWGFKSSFLFGLLTLVLSPVVFILYSIIARVYLEIVIVIFRIAENVSILAKAKQD